MLRSKFCSFQDNSLLFRDAAAAYLGAVAAYLVPQRLIWAPQRLIWCTMRINLNSDQLELVLGLSLASIIQAAQQVT